MELKKVLLVDDENYILQMLKDIIDWEFYGYSIIGEAETAREAMNIYYRESPDIIVTDICMEGISGIDFITRIRLQDMTTKIIILSAYDKFEYARKALKLGVNGYLLKPVHKDELLAAILEAGEMIVSKSDYQNQLQRLKSSFDDLQKKYMEEQLLGIYNSRIDELPQGLADGFSWTVISVKTIVRGDIVFLERDMKSRQEIDSYLLFVEDGVFSLFLKYDGEDKSVVYCLVQEMITKYCKQERSMLFAVSHTDSSRELGACCLECRQLLNSLFYKEEHYYSSNLAAVSLSEPMPEPFNREQFLVLLANQELEACLKQFGGYLTKCAKRNLPRVEVIEYFKRSVSSIMPYLNNSSLNRELEQIAGNAEGVLRSSELYECFRRCIDLISGDKLQMKKSEVIIKNAKNYMRSNCLDENFSIDILADNLSISKSYLSKLFKKETGESVWTYVILVRITKAKELLTSTDATNFEVAKAIGYASEYHFSRAFSKFVGVSPSVYKKMYL